MGKVIFMVVVTFVVFMLFLDTIIIISKRNQEDLSWDEILEEYRQILEWHRMQKIKERSKRP